MGKAKRKKLQQMRSAGNTSSTLSHQAVNLEAEAETSIVKKDMLQTVVVNVVFLAILIGVYYWNQSAGEPLSRFLSNFITI